MTSRRRVIRLLELLQVSADGASVLDNLRLLHHRTSHTMNRAIFIWSAVVIVALLAVPHTHGRPYRRKRVSDQILAEEETKLALRKLARPLIYVPVGYGQVNPKEIGRRRRRSLEVLLQELRNPLTQDGPEVDNVLPNGGEGDEDVRGFVASHQSLPDWFRRPQV